MNKIKLLLLTIFVLLGISQGWAARYGRAVAIAGEHGKVFVSTSATNNPTYQPNSSVDNNKTGSFAGDFDGKFYFYAKADDGYTFVGWSESETVDEGHPVKSTDVPYEFTFKITSKNSSNPTTMTLYAHFAAKQNATTYINPISDIDAADPSVILADDGYYYMYCSESYSGEGIPVWRSADMINWTKITNIFATRPENVTYTYLWAPEIAYVNGRYLLFYANAAYGNRKQTQICVATSDKPYGPFDNNKILLRAHDNNYGAYNADEDNVIDPSLFRDDDGKNYLVWGSFEGIFYIQLDTNCTTLALDAEKNKIAEVGPYNGSYDDWDDIEAPMIVKRNGFYYLVASHGNTADWSKNITYMMRMARSTSLGGKFYNWDDNNNICFDGRMTFNKNDMSTLLESNDYVLGPGHCSQIVKDFNGQEWIFYHGCSKKADGTWDKGEGRRKVFASKVEWDRWHTGWPGIMPPSTTPIETPTVDPKGPVTYQIFNAVDLVAFATAVNNGEVYASATLMNDIDMDGITYTPIGTETNKFRGVIDGQGYRIKNLTINGGDNTGLVAYADGGAQFRYIIIDSTCEISGGTHTGAFLGRLDGSGVVQFYCCGNEAHVTGGQNTAGFVGCDTGVTLYFDNCYNTGYIEGGSESAAFSGWGVDRLRSCWNTGRTMGCESAGDGKWFSLARDYNANKNVNSYDLNADNAPLTYDAAPVGYDSSWLSNGHITYYINQHAGMDVWYQNVDASFGVKKDAHPVFLTSHLPVYNDGDNYYNVVIPGKYERPIGDNPNYGTLCIGYDTYRTENATFYKVVAVREKEDVEGYSTIVIEELDEDDQQHLEAGVAYVFKPSSANVTVTCYYNDCGYRDAIKAPGLVGNLVSDKMQIPAGDYILSNNQFRLVEPGAKAYIARNRAYISGLGYIVNHGTDLVTNSSKVVCFGDDWNFDDDTTEIEGVEIEVRDKNAAMYNLAGQRITEPVPGQVYIQNGKKYIAR